MYGYRVDQAEYVIHVRVAASQECVNTYSTRRLLTHDRVYRMGLIERLTSRAVCVVRDCLSAMSVESRIGLKKGFGLTVGKLPTLK